MKPKLVYWPVACDLEKTKKGNHIIVGPETKESCDGVIKHIKENFSNNSTFDYVVVPAAGVPRKSIWGDRAMCFIMADYFLEKKIQNENLIPIKGKTFNTEGEARGIVDFLMQNRGVMKVVISVKWWHAIRCYVWLHLYMNKYQISNVEVEVLPLSTNVGVREIMFEFCKAIPLNLFRMALFKIFK